MIWMDVDAALSEVPVNAVPLIDDTDFKSIEASVAYNAAGMALYWHFVTTAGAETTTQVTPTTGGSYDWAHAGQGMYTIEIPASGGASINNDTEGFGYFTGVATGVLPWRGPTIGFRAAALNNALIDGGDNLDVNAVEISGDSAAADNLEAACDGTTYNIGGGAVVAASVTGAVGSVTGAVGSVTGAVGSVTGAVGSVTGLTASDVGAIKTRVELALPAAAPAGLNGLPTADASNYIAGIAGTKNQLDDLNDLSQANVRSAVGLASANLDTQLDALPTAAENAAALLDLSNGIETSITPRQAIRLILAAAAGKLSGAATTTIVIRNVGDSVDRITATVDADGNRTAVTTDAT